MNKDPIEMSMIGPFIIGEAQALYNYEACTQLGLSFDHFSNASLGKAWWIIGKMITDGLYTPERFLSYLLNSEEIAMDSEDRSLWIHEVSKCGSSNTMTIHAIDIMEKFLRQEAEIAMASIKGEKGSEIINEIENKINELRSKGITTKKDEKLEACQELKKEINDCLNGNISLRSTHVPIWDKCIGGLPEAQLIILAGRPGGGKTSLAEQVIDESTRRGVGVLYIQRELSRTRAVGRLACRRANVPWWKVEKRKISKEEGLRMIDHINQYESLPIHITSLNTCNSTTVAPLIRYHAKHHGVKLVVLDYIQLIEPPKGVERWVAIGDVTKSMKRAANDTGVTIIGIAQLGRDQEKRRGNNSKPTLSDLRESGNIEQDADVVLGLWMDEEHDDLSKYPVCWTLMKNRNGPKGTTRVLFDGPHMSFIGEVTEQKTENWYDK